MHLKKKRKKLLHSMAVLLCLGLLCLFPLNAFAAVQVKTQIPVACTGKNTQETFQVNLQSDEAEFQSIDTTVLNLQDGETGVFTIRYTCPGTYHYQISQQAGTDGSTTYDSSVYTVDVYVTEDRNGILYAEPVVYAQGSDEKQAEVRFVNSRQTKTITPTPTASGKTSKTGAVDTGDRTIFAVYLAALGIATLIVLLLLRQIQKKEEKR